MKTATFLTAFIIAGFAGFQAQSEPHRTYSNGCVGIHVPDAIHDAAFDAGLSAWMQAQCGEVS